MEMVRHLEMSISQEEFARLLPAAVGGTEFTVVDGHYGGREDQRTWTIRLLPLPVRQLGSVQLPRHRVEIFLQGYSEQEAEAFMVRFHRGFLRGGG